MLKAVILAAGMASRLRPLTNTTPKCLLQIRNKTLLGLTLDNLQGNNIFDVVIVTGFEAGQIRDYISRHYTHIRVEYVHNPDYSITNNSYSLWLSEPLMRGHSLLLLDSDIIFEPSVIHKLLLSGYSNVLALDTSHRHMLGDEEIKVRADSSNRVLEISKEVNPALAIGESIGIEYFCKETTEHLFKILQRRIMHEKRVNEFYEASFEAMIKKGEEVCALDISPARCMEIDTPADLKNAEKLLNLSVL